MTIFNSSRLLVSFPAAEIASLDLPGSIMSPEQTMTLPVSDMLTCALNLVQSHCQKRGIEVRYIARPEIFTHGIPAAWLQSRLSDFTEHLCLTDASTVKHVDFCRTHIFLYRMAQYDSYLSFRRLQRRAPELLQSIDSQLNTCFAWGTDTLKVQPTPFYLEAIDPPIPSPALAYPFQYRPYKLEEVAQRLLSAKPRSMDEVPLGTHTLYVPLTETSLHDQAFTRAIARQVRETFNRPDTTLLLRLPNGNPGESLLSRFTSVLERLALSGTILPRNPAQNIFLINNDLRAIDGFDNVTIILPESFEFWRHNKEFYRKANSIQVLASSEYRLNPEFMEADVTILFGPNAYRVWLEPPRRADQI